MTKEKSVVLVDLLDQELGQCFKTAAHAEPKLHRAFSVFLYAGQKLLIQQRALAKYHCGGLWANTCCSHPAPGELLLNSAQQRLKEETGLTNIPLKELFAFPYFAKFNQQLYEYEYDHVFIGQVSPSLAIEDIPFDPKEIHAMAWVSFSQLLQDLQERPQEYGPWFLISAPLVMKALLNKQPLGPLA